jgi:hypothetical protein
MTSPWGKLTAQACVHSTKKLSKAELQTYLSSNIAYLMALVENNQIFLAGFARQGVLNRKLLFG